MNEDKLYCPHCGSSQLVANKKGFGAGKALTGVLLTGGIGLLAGFIGSGKIKVTCLKCGRKMNIGELRSTPLAPKPIYVQANSASSLQKTVPRKKKKRNMKIKLIIFSSLAILCTTFFITKSILSNIYPLINKGDYDQLIKFEQKILNDRAINNKENIWFLGSVRWNMTKKEVLDNIRKSGISKEVFFDSHTHSKIVINEKEYFPHIKYLFNDSSLLMKINIVFPNEIPTDEIIKLLGKNYLKVISPYYNDYIEYYWLLKETSIKLSLNKELSINRYENTLCLKSTKDITSTIFDEYFSYEGDSKTLNNEDGQLIYSPIISYIEKENFQNKISEKVPTVLGFDLGMTEKDAKDKLFKLEKENCSYIKIPFNKSDSIQINHLKLEFEKGKLSMLSLHSVDSKFMEKKFCEFLNLKHGNYTFIRDIKETWWIKDNLTIIHSNFPFSCFRYTLTSIVKHNELTYKQPLIGTSSIEESENVSESIYSSSSEEKLPQQYKGSKKQKQDLDAIDEYTRTHPGF